MMGRGMERLFALFDQKHQEYREDLDEKSWADAALAQSHLQGIINCMWADWDKDAEDAQEIFEKIAFRRDLMDE